MPVGPGTFLHFPEARFWTTSSTVDNGWNDIVLYRSSPGFANSATGFWGHCRRWRPFARVDGRCEMPPMAFLDPGAFVGINPMDELINSHLPATRTESHTVPPPTF